MPKEMGESLPPHVVFEILIRTDVESLPTLRWVCKKWHRLISQPEFMHRHHQKTKNVRGFIFQPKLSSAPVDAISFFPHIRSLPSSEPALPALDFLPEPVKIEASTSHGLLCCLSLKQDRQSCYVCKPTTKEWTEIPLPNTKHVTLKMGMDVISVNPLRFLIVRATNLYQWELFDSDSWGRWKSLDKFIPFKSKSTFWNIFHKTKIVNGCLCWYNVGHVYGRLPKIMLLDLFMEELKAVELPQEMFAGEEGNIKFVISLMNIDGGLGVLCLNKVSKVYELWVMRSMEHEINSWEKKGSMDGNILKVGGIGDFFVDDVQLLRGEINQNGKEYVW